MPTCPCLSAHSVRHTRQWWIASPPSLRQGLLPLLADKARHDVHLIPALETHVLEHLLRVRRPEVRREQSSPALKQRHRICGRIEAEFRSEEHTSELQSRFDLVCRLLLEKQQTT